MTPSMTPSTTSSTTNARTDPGGEPRWTRRRVIGMLAAGGATAAVVAAVPAALRLASDDGPIEIDLLTSTSESFQRHVGSTFTVDGQHLVLTAVAPVGPSAFDLEFTGSGTTLAQGTYQFAHRRISTFPLFVVPGRPGDGGTTYIASINHGVVQ